MEYRKSNRILYVVGVGPGDPELITVKGLKVLKESEVIFYPAKDINEDSLALKTVKKYITGKKTIRLIFPMTKDKNCLTQSWSLAANTIKKESFHKAAFITLGDPSIYSTFLYIKKLIEDSIEINIIPGITSFCACAARAQIPLALGGESIAIVSMNHKINWESLKGFNTVIFMKPAADQEIKDMQKYGFNHIINARRCTLPDEEITINKKIKKRDYLSLIIAKR